MILRDLQAVMGPNLSGVLLPKITGAADMHAADAILGCVETELGLPVGHTMLYPILETANAIRNAYEIAMASPRVAYMGGAVSRFGDIVGDIGFRWTRAGTETLFIREKVLIDARAAGIRYPISGMWGGANDDLDGLRRVAHRAPRHRLLRDDARQPGARRDRERRVHTERRTRSRTGQDLDRLATAAEREQRAGDLRRREPGRGPRDPHRARRDRAQAAHVGEGAGRRMTTKPREIRAGLSHPIIDADGHFVEVAPLLNEEMLTYLEEMGGPEVRDRYALDTGLTDTSTVLAGHPGARRRGLERDAVVVGLGDREHPRPRDRAPARAPLRTPRRDRHRLHDPVSVDDARVPRGRRRRAHRPAVPRREPRAREPVRAVPRSHHGRRAGSDARSEARGRRARVRGARARLQDRGVRRATPGARSAAAARTGSTRSASTARSTTTRSGRSASSSASRRCSTARCSRTASPDRRRATCTTTSAVSARATSRCASRCSSRA